MTPMEETKFNLVKKFIHYLVVAIREFSSYENNFLCPLTIRCFKMRQISWVWIIQHLFHMITFFQIISCTNYWLSIFVFLRVLKLKKQKYIMMYVLTIFFENFVKVLEMKLHRPHWNLGIKFRYEDIFKPLHGINFDILATCENFFLLEINDYLWSAIYTPWTMDIWRKQNWN